MFVSHRISTGLEPTYARTLSGESRHDADALVARRRRFEESFEGREVARTDGEVDPPVGGAGGASGAGTVRAFSIGGKPSASAIERAGGAALTAGEGGGGSSGASGVGSAGGGGRNPAIGSIRSWDVGGPGDGSGGIVVGGVSDAATAGGARDCGSTTGLGSSGSTIVGSSGAPEAGMRSVDFVTGAGSGPVTGDRFHFRGTDLWWPGRRQDIRRRRRRESVRAPSPACRVPRVGAQRPPPRKERPARARILSLTTTRSADRSLRERALPE